MSAIRFCSCCQKPITTNWVWCKDCLELWGVEGKRYATWPENVREMYCADQAMWDRQTRDLERESEETMADDDDWYSPGSSIDEELGPSSMGSSLFEEASVYEDDSSGGKITCCKCHHVFSDLYPTFPLDPKQWIVPVCPECGGGRFESQA